MQVKVTLSGSEAGALAARAARERRSVAQMGGLLIAAALEGEEELVVDVGATPEDARSAGMASGARGRPSARAVMCEHRVPAEQFCKRCDGLEAEGEPTGDGVAEASSAGLAPAARAAAVTAASPSASGFRPDPKPGRR